MSSSLIYNLTFVGLRFFSTLLSWVWSHEGSAASMPYFSVVPSGGDLRISESWSVEYECLRTGVTNSF